jgi:hypothetical protein
LHNMQYKLIVSQPMLPAPSDEVKKKSELLQLMATSTAVLKRMHRRRLARGI